MPHFSSVVESALRVAIVGIAFCGRLGQAILPCVGTSPRGKRLAQVAAMVVGVRALRKTGVRGPDKDEDKPPRGTSSLGQKQLMAAFKALDNPGGGRPIQGQRVTQQHFEVVLDDDVEPLLKKRWDQWDFGDDPVDEAYIRTWVGWGPQSPTEVFVGQQKVGVLRPTDADALRREAHEAHHGTDPIRAAGYTRLTDKGWVLRLIVRRDHSEGLHLG